MKKKIYFILFFLWFCFIGVTESFTTKTNAYIEYHRFANKGAYFFYKAEYDSSLFYYNKALNLETKGYSNERRNDFYNVAKCYSIYRDTLKTCIFLSKSIIIGKQLSEIMSDTIFNFLRGCDSWEKIKKDYNANRNQFLAEIDTVLKSEIESMANQDQKYRKLFYETGKNEDSLSHLQKKIDRYNENRLAFIIDSIGYPGYKLIGCDKADILITHTSGLFREKYFRKLVDEIRKGNIDPQVVAGMVDQKLVLANKPQIYGSVFRGDEVIGLEFCPFKYNDLTKIDSLRASLGLTDIRYLMDEYNVSLPYSFNLQFELDK